MANDSSGLGPLVKSECLSDISAKDAKWDAHRSNTQDIGAIYRASEGFFGLARRMASCSRTLYFGEQIDRDTGEIRLRLRQAMFCKVRHCPVCAWRRSMRNTARFFAQIPELETKFPKHRWLFLTLTVRNPAVGDLRKTLNAMNAGWKRLIERKDWPATGWVRATEVTRGADGSAHPHFHVLLMVPASYYAGRNYITQQAWAERWQSVMRIDYTPTVDIRAVKPKHEGQSLHAAVVETLKYATKVEDALQHPEWLYAITEQLYKLRFLASGGALKGVLKEQMTDEEMVVGDEPDTPEDDTDARQVFGWKPTLRRYIKKP